MDNYKGKLEITELFMAQADIDRRFFGTIKRGFDADGTPVVYGKIKLKYGFIYAKATNQDELGENLDEMVKMALDVDLQIGDRATSVIAGIDYFLN